MTAVWLDPDRKRSPVGQTSAVTGRAELTRRAQALGVAVSYQNWRGRHVEVPDETLAAVRACTADDLGVWLAVAQLDGAAGSVYYPLQFTNLSRHACAMRGFAGVSAVDRNLHQLGSPAGRAHVVPVRTVVLAPGRTAHAVLRYGDVTVSTAPGCHPTFRTFELRVYPPGQHHATYAAFDFEVCSHAGPVYMDIGPIQAGVGTRF